MEPRRPFARYSAEGAPGLIEFLKKAFGAQEAFPAKTAPGAVVVVKANQWATWTHSVPTTRENDLGVITQN